MNTYGFKVGDKVRRKNTKSTRPSTHPTRVIWRFYHSGGIDFVVFEDGLSSMSCAGLEYYEKVRV